jgi:hypothetical protein
VRLPALSAAAAEPAGPSELQAPPEAQETHTPEAVAAAAAAVLPEPLVRPAESAALPEGAAEVEAGFKRP